MKGMYVIKPVSLAALLTLLVAGSARAHEQPRDAPGQLGDARKVDRTIDITMDDAMRFHPAVVRVKAGETVRFRVRNTGSIRHEMVIGSMKELREHAALMRKFPEMEHAEPNQATVDPGNTGELVWQFRKPGTFDFACLQPGHFEAGMRGRVVVER